MKVGDLVIWIGPKGIPDEWYGDLGIVVRVKEDCWDLLYNVRWSDGTLGKRLYEEELMVINNDVPER